MEPYFFSVRSRSKTQDEQILEMLQSQQKVERIRGASLEEKLDYIDTRKREWWAESQRLAMKTTERRKSTDAQRSVPCARSASRLAEDPTNNSPGQCRSSRVQTLFTETKSSRTPLSQIDSTRLLQSPDTVQVRGRSDNRRTQKR